MPDFSCSEVEGQVLPHPAKFIIMYEIAQSPAHTALVLLHLRSELCNTLLGVKLLKMGCLALGIGAKSRHFASTSVLCERPLQPGDAGGTLFSQA